MTRPADNLYWLTFLFDINMEYADILNGGEGLFHSTSHPSKLNTSFYDLYDCKEKAR